MGPSPGQAKEKMFVTILKLIRAPNVFTAISDVVMGFLFVTQGTGSFWTLFWLILATSCLYSAGMVLNDVYDVEDDKKERPHRPIPSGQISLANARILGVALLVVGALLGTVACWTSDAAFPWRGAVTATALVVCIVLYDAVVKKTAIAPWLMGGCRFFNILMGMSIAPTGNNQQMYLLGYHPVELLVAASIGIYIVGVTWFARTEAKASNRNMLIFGFSLMVVGIAMLLPFPEMYASELFFRNNIVWPMLLLLLTFTVARRCVIAIGSLEPKAVQVAVKQSILSLILIDAAICLAVGGLVAGIAVVALLAPTLSLGKWIYST